MKRLVEIVVGTNHELAVHKRPFSSTELVLNEDTGELRRGPGFWHELRPWVRNAQSDVEVSAASLTNVTIATGLNAGDTVGGVTLEAGHTVLLMGQTDAKQNGIYTAAVSPTRTPAFSAMEELSGRIITVTDGTHASRVFVNTNQGGAIGSDYVTFVPWNPTPLTLGGIGVLTQLPNISPVLDTDVLLLQRADGTLGRVTAATLKTYIG